MMSLRGAAALGVFFAWQSTLMTSLFPMAGAPLFSPQVTLAFLACLAMVAILRGQLSLHRPSGSRVRAFWGLVGVTSGTLAACVASLAAASALPIAYGCAIVAGGALSLGLYVWIYPLARLDAHRRAATLMAAIALAQLASFLMGALPLGAPVILAFVLCGLLAVAGLVVWDDANEGPSSEVTYRPTSSQHYRLLLVSLVLYAFVFGSVAGTTSIQTAPDGLGTFTRQVSGPALAIALACLLALLPTRGAVRLAVMGRVLTPLLAVLFLIHLVLPSAGRSWLPPITLAFWQFVQAFVVLLVIEISQSGVGSLGLVLSAGWAMLSGGFALGCLVGSASSTLFGAADIVVNAMIMMHTVLAVIASSLMAAARYPQVGAAFVPQGSAGLAEGAAAEGAGDTARRDVAQALPLASSRLSALRFEPLAAGGNAGGETVDPVGGLASADGVGGERAVPVAGAASIEDGPRADAIARACAQLAAKHGLSGREVEVLELLARGNTRQSIATKLVVSENTVRTHVKNIYAKLYIHSKQQLIDLVDAIGAPRP